MAQVFGDDAGVGARSAVGMGSLPMNIPVEIECIFEVSSGQ
jgi:enamine deaminase RidA (YjgF/YER057c/UK114 family)